MSEKNFDIFLEFNYSKLNLAAFSKINGKLEYYKVVDYSSFFHSNDELNFEKIHKLAEENIIEIEKSIGEFVRDVYLIIETPENMSIKFSVKKNYDGKKISKDDATYLIQDAKQQILKSNIDYKIVHIIVEKYILNNIDYKFLPTDKKSDNFSIDINFICFPKDLISSFEKLFFKQQISINRFICSNYLKKLDFFNNDNKICVHAKNVIDGKNKQEVAIIQKNRKKTGFFEKLFHLFK